MQILQQFCIYGKIPRESLESLIITIPKSSKSPNEPANYRPKSVPNMDIKLYATLLATRLCRCISNLVHPDQVGFIPN